MPTIGELINNIAQKAGIASDNPKLKSLLASPELASVQVDAELSLAVDSALISIESAKNNHPEIRNKYTSDVYDSLDKNLWRIIEEGDFSNEEIAEIKAEPKTRERYAIVISKLKAAKANAKGADKDEINKQLTAAHEAARLAKAEVETVRKNYEGRISDINRKAAVKAAFANYKTIYDDLPIAARNAAFEALVNTALQDKNAELKTDDNGNLVLTTKDGSNVFGANHVLLTPASFLDQTFAPILKVSGPPKPAAKSPGSQYQTPTKVDEGAEATVSSISAHNAAVMEQLSKPQATLV